MAALALMEQLGAKKNMKTVKVKVEQLRKHLEENRAKHVIEYAEAMEVYRELLVVKIKESLAKAEQGKDVSHTIDIDRPSNYTSSYDNIIEMLKWTTDEEIYLDQNEFAQYVQDKWSWSNVFGATASMYKGLKGSL